MSIQTRINILVQYNDKCYVYSQMCNSTYEFFSFLRSIINIPLIIISSIMAILNSGSFSSEDMKLPNIVILEYDTIVENIDYTIPTFIKKDT